MKSMAKRIGAILLVMIMVATCTPLSFAVSDTDNSAQTEQEHTEDKSESVVITDINPLYADIVSEEDIPVPEEYRPSEGSMRLMSEDDDVMYCKSADEAGKFVRDGMVSRTESIRVVIEYDSRAKRDDNYISAYNTIKEDVMKHTGDPEEGDYLKWQYKGWSCRVSTYSDSNAYYAMYAYNMSYFTTAQQEKAVSDKVDAILAGISSNACDYELAKGIYDYICKNVSYDYSGAADSSNVICHSAYSAAVLKKSVCQGYALLYYRAALEAGLDTRLIAGYNSSGGGHAWNIVRVDGKYYYIDSTWDAGLKSYKYFLKGKSTFTGHSAYKQESLDRTYSINSGTYTYSPVSTYISSLSRGKKSIAVKWASKAKYVTGYQVRYSRYSSMKSAKTVTISSPSSTSKTIKSLKRKKRYYVQVRTYKKMAGTYFYSSWSSKKSIKTK